MTGFARVQGEHGGDSWVWEVKSVNARGLDVRVRLPSGHYAVETAVREGIAKRTALRWPLLPRPRGQVVFGGGVLALVLRMDIQSKPSSGPQVKI